MSSLNARLEVEFELITKILSELPPSRTCTGLSKIELAGVAALLHNFYNGIEKMLKDILNSMNLSLPEGANWHRDLVKVSVQHQVLAEETAQALRVFVAFRHFFVHAYVIDLDEERLQTLVQKVDAVFEQVKRDLEKYR